jgi:hypothetical protein
MRAFGPYFTKKTVVKLYVSSLQCATAALYAHSSILFTGVNPRHCYPVLLQHQPTVFYSHTTPAAVSSHQSASSVFLSHHSSSSLQHQHSEQGPVSQRVRHVSSRTVRLCLVVKRMRKVFAKSTVALFRLYVVNIVLS